MVVNTPAETPPADTEPPSAPTNLRLVGEPSSTLVSLAWNASTDNVGVIGYRLLRDNIIISPDPVTDTNYTDNTVSTSSTYDYRVEAFDQAQNVSISDILSVTTPDVATDDTEPPSRPANLRLVGAASSTSFTIAWDAVSDTDLSGYRVYYDTTSPLVKNNAGSADLPASTTSWVMDPSNLGFQPCDTVTLAIAALSTVKNESAFSNIVNQLVE